MIQYMVVFAKGDIILEFYKAMFICILVPCSSRINERFESAYVIRQDSQGSQSIAIEGFVKDYDNFGLVL